jgi:hypothetical protein
VENSLRGNGVVMITGMNCYRHDSSFLDESELGFSIGGRRSDGRDSEECESWEDGCSTHVVLTQSVKDCGIFEKTKDESSRSLLKQQKTENKLVPGG